MNLVVLIGRFTRNPELRTTQNGTTFCNFTLAVDRRFKNDNGPDADFINCTAWGRTAEVINQYLSKGQQIAIQGRIQTSSYQDRNGNTQYRTDVIVDQFDFISNRNGGNYNQNNQNNYDFNQDRGYQNNNNNYQRDNGVAPLQIDDDFSLLADDDDVPF